MLNEYSLHPINDQFQLKGQSIHSAVIHNSSIPIPKNISKRFELTDIEIENCKHWACNLHGAILKDIRATKLTGGKGIPAFFWGCVYSNVILKGEISGVLFRWQVDPQNEAISKKVLKHNISLYKEIPLAIDISEAKFTTFQDIQGVPASLIKRNPDWHYVVNRENAKIMHSNVQEYGIWSLVYDTLKATGLDDTVVVLAQKGKKYKEDREFAEELRKQGMLE